MALWRLLETGVIPEGAERKAAWAVCRCCVRLGPWCGWRRPVIVPGLAKKPS